MSKDNLHIDFDNTLREKFEGAETLPAHENWDKLESAIESGANDAFDLLIKNRFDKEVFSSNAIATPPSLHSDNAKIRRRFFWVLLILLLAIPPIAYNYFKKSNSASENKQTPAKEISQEIIEKQEDKEERADRTSSVKSHTANESSVSTIANDISIDENPSSQNRLNNVTNTIQKKSANSVSKGGSQKKFRNNDVLNKIVKPDLDQHILIKAGRIRNTANENSTSQQNKKTIKINEADRKARHFRGYRIK